MQVLFCRPRSPQRIADRFELEIDALEELGLDHHMVALEDVVDGELDSALDVLPGRGGGELLYRGWMLTFDEYDALSDALGERGFSLVVDPSEYEAAHYLPSYYGVIAKRTARSRWTIGTDLDEAWTAAHELGDGPWFLKDHVKSAKELGADATIIPARADRATFDEHCTRLLDARGDRFERGFVFRDVLPLATLRDPHSGALGTEEYRLFFWQGRLVAASAYDDFGGDQTRFTSFAWLGRSIESPFFSADVARLQNGALTILEIGDGGVSTIPPVMDPRDLYRGIFATSQR